MRLLLVRHPRPDVAAGVCYGSADVPANAEETRRVHTTLSDAGFPGPLPVYASPLRRCAGLARLLAGDQVVFDARLAEMDFGAWELRSWDDIGRDAVDAWNADLLHYRPGGGESLLQVARRVTAFRDALYAAGHPEALVICHAGTMRLLTAMQGGAAPEQAALQAASTPHRIAYGEMLVLKD
ncbi:histidine phosphatase family protein [Massilia suwonensis]|uniref:Histidine phosphatase family protein n=1 Tax=Massilia suwonensis TaxID=648895 RepID=A0ABW0MH27_9BURK